MAGMPDVFRTRARTFWFAARFLPADRRPAVAGLYAFAEEFHLRPRHRYWLHALLLLATLLSTTIVGAGMAHSFAQNQPVDF